MTLFLFVLRPEKIPDCSHQSGSEKRRPASRRVPSGRAVDSTWMTSAPSMASTWVHERARPRTTVRSRTRSPSNGSAGAAGAGSTRAGRPLGAVCSPSVGAARVAEQRRVEPVGPVGLDEAVARVPDDRAPRLEVVGGGDRLAVADRGVRDAEGAGELEDLRRGVLGHPRGDRPGGGGARLAKSDRSSIHSGWSTITQKSSHCCPVPTPSPTRPSLVVSTPGVTIDRPLPERPAHHVDVGHRVVGEAQRQRLEHRHVDELAGPVLARARPRDQRPDGGVARRSATRRSGRRRDTGARSGAPRPRPDDRRRTTPGA